MNEFYGKLPRAERAKAEQLRETVEATGFGSTYFEPGNGTRISVVLTRVSSSMFGGNLCVSLPEFKKAWVMQVDGYYEPSYIAEKFGLGGSDATAFADIMNIFASHRRVGV